MKAYRRLKKDGRLHQSFGLFWCYTKPRVAVNTEIAHDFLAVAPCKPQAIIASTPVDVKAVDSTAVDSTAVDSTAVDMKDSLGDATWYV